jgi:formamidopyrimidine-DNA glycosylase
MPEMPEVSALAGFLAERLTGAEITQLQFGAFFVLKTADPPYSMLIGRKVESVSRRGKFVIIATEPGTADGGTGDQRIYLLFHLALAGWLQYHDVLPKTKLKSSKALTEARFGFRKEDGEFGFDLTEAGTWKRLSVHIVRQPEDVPAVAALGPEPLDEDFDLESFSRLLAPRQQIKGLLRDQKVIAGIGNAYSDEILHAAKLSPFALAASLKPDEVEKLYKSLKDVLADAVREAAGKPPSELKDSKRASMRVHRRTGLPCPVCGDTILEVSFSDSSLQYCPTCQTGGKPLADRRTSKFLK